MNKTIILIGVLLAITLLFGCSQPTINTDNNSTGGPTSQVDKNVATTNPQVTNPVDIGLTVSDLGVDQSTTETPIDTRDTIPDAPA
jgi:hypothetical protein